MPFTWRATLTYDHTKCGVANSSNFPALIYASHATLKTVANGGYVQQADGSDIIPFTDATLATQIPSQAPVYDGVNGVVWMRVGIAALSASVDGSIVLAVGNATPPARTAGVWDANVKTACEFPNGTVLSLTDSAGVVAPTQPAAAVTATAGQVDGAASFSGAADSYIQLAANGTGVYNSQNATIEVWVKTPAAWGLDTDYRILFSYDKTSHASPYYGLHLRFTLGAAGGAGKLLFAWNDGSTLQGLTSTNALATNTWYHVVAVFTSGRQEIWGNGLQLVGAGTRADTITFWAQPAWIERANFVNPGKTLVVDEFLFHNTARSASWITASFNNGNAPGNIGAPGFWTWSAWSPVGAPSLALMGVGM